MGDDDKEKPKMEQPVIRVRERVRQPPVQPVSPAPVRVRERVRLSPPIEAPAPPPVKIRERERPLPRVPNPDAYEWGPGMKEIQRKLNVWRAGTKPDNHELAPPLPDVWPQGSAIMRAPQHPGYRRHPHVMGEEPEKNPNLMGRSVNGRELGRPGGVYLWKWQAMKYVFVGRFEHHGEVHAALRK